MANFERPRRLRIGVVHDQACTLEQCRVWRDTRHSMRESIFSLDPHLLSRPFNLLGSLIMRTLMSNALSCIRAMTGTA